MNYRNRWLETKIIDLLAHFPIVAILGARQTGKSTLVEHLPVSGLKTVVFDPVMDRFGALEDPDLFLQNQPEPLFLDEVQHAPEVLAALKRRVDADRRPGRHVISGSQNLAVLRSVSESLAGRVAVLRLLPLGTAEIEGRAGDPGFLWHWLFEPGFEPGGWRCSPPRGVFQRLWRGGMPGLLDLPDRLVTDYFSSYVQTYVERDVRTAAEPESLRDFGRFFGLLAALTAGEVNHNQLGRDLGLSRGTAVKWGDIAAATYQWVEVPAWSRNAVKRISGKPKGYLTDPGLACFLQSVSSADALAAHPLAGQLFETWIALEVMKRRESWPVRPAVHHFRAHSGAEVDLVLELDGRLHPVEVKLGTNPTRADCRGFDGLAAACPGIEIGRKLVVAACEEVRRLREDTWAVPWWEL
jgi:hypothetical protein